MDDKDLDRMLNALDSETPEPSADLLGRVLADAYEAQPVAPRETREEPLSGWQQVLGVFGGWGGLGGLAVAASVGFAIGFNPPVGLQVPFGLEFGSDLTELDSSLSGFGWDLDEG